MTTIYVSVYVYLYSLLVYLRIFVVLYLHKFILYFQCIFLFYYLSFLWLHLFLRNVFKSSVMRVFYHIYGLFSYSLIECLELSWNILLWLKNFFPFLHPRILWAFSCFFSFNVDEIAYFLLIFHIPSFHFDIITNFIKYWHFLYVFLFVALISIWVA